MPKVTKGLLALFLIISTGLLSCTKQKDDVSDSVVLKVNDSTLNVKRFAELLAYQLRDLSAVTVKDPGHIYTAKKKVINDYVIQIITRDWAKQNDVRIKKDGEDGWLKAVEQLRSNYPDDLAFRQSLNDSGLTEKEWEARVRFSVLQKKVMAKISADIGEPSEKELRNFYKSNKADFKTPPRVKLHQVVLSTEADAKRILQELRSRRPLAELAKKYSVSPDGELGGELGWIEKGTDTVFDAAFKLRVGRLSHIIKSPFGFHIYKVSAKQPGKTRPFNQVKDQIRKRLLANREQAAYAGWLETQIRNTRVFKNTSLIDNLIVETRGN